MSMGNSEPVDLVGVWLVWVRHSMWLVYVVIKAVGKDGQYVFGKVRHMVDMWTVCGQ